MKQQSFSLRQICLLFVTLIPVSKIILLPTLLAFEVGRDAYLSVLLCGAVDALALLSLCIAAKRAPEADFFSLLSAFFQKGFSRVLLFLYGVFFLLRAVPPTHSCKLLAINTLYDVTPSLFVFVPFILCATYAAWKGLRIILRVNEFFWPFFFGGVLLLILLGLSSSDLFNLLPVLEFGPSPVAKGAFFSLPWFGDFMPLLLLLGKLAPAKRRAKKAILAYAGGIVLTALFFVCFFGVFGETAVRQTYAITKIGKYNTVFSNIGRLDWLPVLLILMALFVRIALDLACAASCFSQALSKSATPPLLVCSAALLIFVSLPQVPYADIYHIFSRFLVFAFLPLQLGIPLLTPLFASRFQKQRKELPQ